MDFGTVNVEQNKFIDIDDVVNNDKEEKDDDDEDNNNNDDDDDDHNHLKIDKSSKCFDIRNIIENDNDQKIILYVMVVGFHHKKGCLVEFSYPPLTNSLLSSESSKNETEKISEETVRLPKAWQTLPSLAMPDGAHNYDKDTVFFNLPDIDDPNRTVFGVACYQQIKTKSLKVRSSDMTRSSVQKSVVALLQLPLYGFVERKLRIVTRSYFEELDFSQTSILIEFYHSMMLQLNWSLMDGEKLNIGFSVRALFAKFGQQVITLFKLMLLERKTLFVSSPIRELSGHILTLCSLFPGLLREGMFGSHLPLEINSHDNDINDEDDDDGNRFKGFNESYENTQKTVAVDPKTDCDNNNHSSAKNNSEKKNCSKKNSQIFANHNQLKKTNKLIESSSSVSLASTVSSDEEDLVHINYPLFIDNDVTENHEANDSSEIQCRKQLYEVLSKPDHYFGLPLSFFGHSSNHRCCLPYFSISYFDFLISQKVGSCFSGSSNQIFIRWENDIEVFVVDKQIEIIDSRLKRLLTPTVEDLRFVTYIMRALNLSPSNSTFYLEDQYENEYESQEPLRQGSDQWVRLHFKNYLLKMLRCSLLDASTKQYRSFNSLFMSEWKKTQNYQSWRFGSNSHPNKSTTHVDTLIQNIDAQHPFAGNRIKDISFKITNFFTSRQENVNQASKLVMNSARSTLTSLFSTIGSSSNQAKTLFARTVQLANQLVDDSLQPTTTSSKPVDESERRTRISSSESLPKKNTATKQHIFGYFDTEEVDDEEQETSV